MLTKESTEDGVWWVAQCLDHDIATQARTLEDAVYDLQRMLVARIITAEQMGIADPFADVPAAPPELWELFDAGGDFEIRAPEHKGSGVIVPTIDARAIAA